MKATELYFPVVLFIMLYKVAEILWFYHSKESCLVVLSSGGVQSRCTHGCIILPSYIFAADGTLPNSACGCGE